MGGTFISKALGFALVVAALSAPAFANRDFPEMDSGMAMSAMALLSGGLLMIAGRRRHA